MISRIGNGLDGALYKKQRRGRGRGRGWNEYKKSRKTRRMEYMLKTTSRLNTEGGIVCARVMII